MSYIPYAFRVILVVILGIMSFLIPAIFENVWIKLLGVCMASIGSGLGEITFLALSAHYDKNTVSAWSSGTGGAGIFGAVSYLVLRSFLSNKMTLFVCSPMPFLFILSYFVLLSKPASLEVDEERKPVINENIDNTPPMTFKQKLQLFPKLLPFHIPLFCVYFGEYVINSAVDPLLVFPKDKLFSDSKVAYRYYQAIYQIGVFISRSSVNLFPIRKIWIPAALQIANAAFLSTVAIYDYLPSIYIVFAIILFEGLLGGSIYVNAFYLISQRFEYKEKEFALGATSMSYSFSIMIAAVFGIFYQGALTQWRCTHSGPFCSILPNVF